MLASLILIINSKGILACKAKNQKSTLCSLLIARSTDLREEGRLLKLRGAALYSGVELHGIFIPVGPLDVSTMSWEMTEVFLTGLLLGKLVDKYFWYSGNKKSSNFKVKRSEEHDMKMFCAVVSISWPSSDSSRKDFMGARQLLLAIFPLFLFFKVVIGSQIKMPQVEPIPIISDIPYGIFSVSSWILC